MRKSQELVAAGAVLQPDIEIVDVRHAFRTGRQSLPVISNISLTVRPNEFVSIVGPSGCGKSTLFNIIGGLVTPTSGTVRLRGEPVTGPHPAAAYMMQRDLLLPWRTILDNVVLGQEIQRRPIREARERARSLMSRFGLAGYEGAYPAQISGGMRQRAALMRTLLLDRQVVLLDEPFGGLDALTKALMQEWLLGIWEDFRRTMVFITHDVDEALFLSDRVFVLSARPTRVKEVLEAPLPRPRDHSLTTSGQFVALKKRIIDVLWEEGMKHVQGLGDAPAEEES